MLFDPFLTGNPAAKATADQLAADYILLSHGHFDHMPDTVSIAQRTGRHRDRHAGTGYLDEQPGRGQRPRHAAGRLVSLSLWPGQADHCPPRLDVARRQLRRPGCGLSGRYRRSAGLLHRRHRAVFMDMQLYGEEGIDVLILPIGDNFTMGPEDALRCVRFVQPKLVIPLHYDTWPPIVQDSGRVRRGRGGGDGRPVPGDRRRGAAGAVALPTG
ncbi:MAG: MBL fold metallo-hydrolase [Microthrixaceae bacterium]